MEEKYTPLTLVQAVETCKELVSMFNKKGIEVIRVGLQNTVFRFSGCPCPQNQ